MARQTAEKARHIQIIVPAETYKEFKKICVDEDTNMRAKLLQLMNEAVAASAESKKDFFTMSAEERTALYAQGIREDVARHHAEGRYTTHGDEAGVYRLYPDGRKEYIGPIDRDKERG
jgi:hypothetical protein